MVTPLVLRIDFEGKTGLTPTFDFLKDHADSDLAQPAITEIAGTDGIYDFTLADVEIGVYGRVDPGDGSSGASFDVGPSTLETIDANVDTNEVKIDSILADTAAMEPLVSANLDATISSRSDFDEAVDQVIVATNNDKTDYTLTVADKAALVDLIWDELQAGHVTPNTFGAFLNASVAAIKAKTDSLSFNGANVNSNLKEIDDVIVDDNNAGNLNPLAGDVDWTTGEREQIRDALGVDGIKTAATGGQLQGKATPTQVGTELDNRRLDDLVTDGSAPDPVAGSLVDQMMNKDGGQTFDQALDSLEAQSDRLQLFVPEGLRAVTLTFRDDVTLIPIASVLVTVRADPSGALILANVLTDANGQITLNLDDGDYQVLGVKLPAYADFTPTTFTVTDVMTSFIFEGSSTVPIPPPSSDPIKCNVIADSFQNVAEGTKAEASIIGKDVTTISNQVLSDAERTVKVEADSAGRFTFELIRSTQVKQLSGEDVHYRVIIRELNFNAKILVPDSATAFLGDIIIAN